MPSFLEARAMNWRKGQGLQSNFLGNPHGNTMAMLFRTELTLKAKVKMFSQGEVQNILSNPEAKETIALMYNAVEEIKDKTDPNNVRYLVSCMYLYPFEFAGCFSDMILDDMVLSTGEDGGRMFALARMWFLS